MSASHLSKGGDFIERLIGQRCLGYDPGRVARWGFNVKPEQGRVFSAEKDDQRSALLALRKKFRSADGGVSGVNWF